VESGSYERSPARAERATPARWLRLLASPEHLSGATRAALGGELLGKLKKELADTPWVCGRLGTRIALYGSLVCVVPTETANEWISALLDFAT